MKIQKFQYGLIRSTYISSQKDIDVIQKETIEETGTALPPYKWLLTKTQRPDQLSMLVDDVSIFVETDEAFIDAEFRKGYPFDHSSQPSILDSIINNCGKDITPISLLHDGMFGTNQGFKFSNKLMQALVRYKDFGSFLLIPIHKWIYWGISSWKGKKAYNNSTLSQAWEEEFVSIKVAYKIRQD
jgi:hypothetical protein